MVFFNKPNNNDLILDNNKKKVEINKCKQIILSQLPTTMLSITKLANNPSLSQQIQILIYYLDNLDICLLLNATICSNT